MTTAAWELFKRVLPGLLLAALAIGIGVAIHMRATSQAESHAALVLDGVKKDHAREIATLRGDLEKHRADFEAREREKERKRNEEVQAAADAAQAQVDAARRDAAAATSERDSLRKQARALALTYSAGPLSTAGGGATIAGGGQAASAPALVLADVFGWAADTAGELAAEYDRSRAAGLACERAYNALRNDH